MLGQISVIYHLGSFFLMNIFFLLRFLSKRLDKKGWIYSLGAIFSPNVVLKNKKFQTLTISSSCHLKDSNKETSLDLYWINMMNETADSSNPLQFQLQLEKPFLTKAEHFRPLLLGKKNPY